MTADQSKYPFNVEWLQDGEQHYHGPRQRMRQILAESRLWEPDALDQQSALRWVVDSYPDCVPHFQKVKFYRFRDHDAKMLLRFFILWCGDSVYARERMFEEGGHITRATGWYPVVTGRRFFHHQNPLREMADIGLRQAMNKTTIERQPGLGMLLDVTAIAKSGGTSILLRTTTSDIVLDAGLNEAELQLSEMRKGVRKWLFLSHAHGDHIGGCGVFIKDNRFVIALGSITLELLLASLSRSADLGQILPKRFFYRVAPMWYGTTYHFADSTSIQPLPTYHFPGSMGFLFRFSDGKTLLYTGDLNVRGAYLAHKLGAASGEPVGFDAGPKNIDVGVIEAAFVGRNLGVKDDQADSVVFRVRQIIEAGHHAILLTPPGDYGLYLFLHLYDSVVSKATRTINAKLFLDSFILKQLAILEWRMKRKQVGSLDDACRTWLANRVTLGESVRVFDISQNQIGNVKELVRRKMKGVFILNDRLAEDNAYFHDSARQELESDGLETLLIGKAATLSRDDVSGNVREAFGAGPWLLHSSETELAKYLLSGPQQFGDVYLFHNFGRRLTRFSNDLADRGFAGTIRTL